MPCQIRFRSFLNLLNHRYVWLRFLNSFVKVMHNGGLHSNNAFAVRITTSRVAISWLQQASLSCSFSAHKRKLHHFRTFRKLVDDRTHEQKVKAKRAYEMRQGRLWCRKRSRRIKASRFPSRCLCPNGRRIRRKAFWDSSLSFRGHHVPHQYTKHVSHALSCWDHTWSHEMDSKASSICPKYTPVVSSLPQDRVFYPSMFV